MKLRIRQNRPESLQQVLEAALELSRIGWQAGNVQYQSVRRNSTARMTVLSQDHKRNEFGCAGGVAAVYKMQQLFQECIKSDKDRKGLPREAPGDLLYHRSSSLVGVVVRLGTSRGTARNEPRGVHPIAAATPMQGQRNY